MEWVAERKMNCPRSSNNHLYAIGDTLLDRHLVNGSLWARFFPVYVVHIWEFLTDLSAWPALKMNGSDFILKNFFEDSNQAVLRS